MNARFVVVAAPIEGAVVNSPPKAGTTVSEGEQLLIIQNERVNRSMLSEHQAELRATQAALKASLLRQTGLQSLRDDMLRRLAVYRKAMLENTDREIASQEERIGSSEARGTERKSDLERKQSLRSSGHLSAMELEKSVAGEDVAKHELEGARNELDRLRRKRAAIENDVYIEEGRNDVPYSLQRVDEIDLALKSLLAMRVEQEARIVKFQQQIADEEARTERLRFASVLSELTGVVWRNFVATGSNVTVGQELVNILDCRDLFVEILVHEVDYDDIYPGRDAEVRLLGRSDSIPGRVAFVRGSRADFEDRILAASLPRTEGKYAKIRIELVPSDLNTDYRNFCQVGRTVHVRFRRRSVPLLRWLRSLWFSIS
ncbi:HlyD family efflux transporter periplasmic adaptor subunit [Pseudolabrys sp. FHR47]|uniref:HlyD family efflux transporter periplasmic adaptor subunit n=1 Tax=Pseudolabrys sp. FHR47 TaxID=2562284 RepID=UPI0010BF5E43|nr:HlyD family efflux transporter periplasmic adaptor subunit [Pseudolabrys sp. FHR47]